MTETNSLVHQPSLLKPIVRLAWPVVVEQLLVLMVGLVDTFLTGQFLETHHMAAMGQMAYLLWMIPALMSVISIGTTAVVAREIGAGRRDIANLVTNQALLMGLGISLSLLGAFAIAHDRLLDVLQLRPEAKQAAIEYLRWIIPVLPLMMFQLVGTAAFRGAGNTLSGLLVMGLVNLVNIVLATVLVSGWGGFPKLGWSGLAIGASMGYLTGALFVIVLLLRGDFGLRLQFSNLKPDWVQMKRILSVGLPGGLDMMATVFCHLWFLGIINSLGTLAAAAHGLAIRVEAIAYAPGSAFQVAAATLTGQFLGAEMPQRAAKAVWITSLLCSLTMSSAVLLFFFSSTEVIRCFVQSQDEELIQQASQLLRIVSVGLIPLSVVLVFSGALRGAGDTRGPLVVTFICFILIRIPLSYFLACKELPFSWGGEAMVGLGWGVQGAWYAMVSDLIVRALLLASRFLVGKWKLLKV